MADAFLSILLVEDSPADAALVREQLRADPATQCRIAHVERLSDALHRLETAHVDVVLLDLSLPDSQGLETVRRLQAVSAEVPLVVLSGLHDEEIALQAVREGAQDYLLKGHTDGDVLMRTIRYALERKRAEAVRAQLAAIVESSTDAILSTTLDGRIVNWNTGAEQIYGYLCKEVQGRLTSLLIPPDLYDDMPAVLVRLRGDEHVPPYETVHVTKDGRCLDVLLTVSPLRDATGRVVGASAIARDITERKRAEDAMRQQRDWLDLTLSSIGDAVIVTDQHGRITFMNRVAEELTGWAAQDALGRHVDAVFRLRDEQTRQVVASPVAHVLRQGEIFHLADHLVLITRQDCEEPIADSVAPIRSGKGAIQGAVIIFRTIAERRRLEEQLRQAQKMQAIGTLAGGIAHDFNNLLAVILGYTELAVGDLPSDSPSWSSLQQVLQAGTRARDLVQQILTFSRRAQAERTPRQLHTLVQEALLLLRVSLPSTIEIRQHLDPHSGAVLADATQFHQLLVNLCANAEHAMRPHGGLLEVSLDPVEVDATMAATHPDLCPGTYVRLTVRDTGHGMSPEVVERLYEPFFTTKDVGEGTGLGLSIVHGIVMNHGGAITVQSQPEQGTTFAIYLPRLDEGSTADDEPERVALTHGQGRILLVDDEEALVYLGQTMLARLGYAVTACASSQEALALFQTSPHNFDLVITDYTMPHMTGESLAQAFRQLRPDIPIILTTGLSPMAPEQAKAFGIETVLSKPWMARDLARTIQRVLEERHRKHV